MKWFANARKALFKSNLKKKNEHFLSFIKSEGVRDKN